MHICRDTVKLNDHVSEVLSTLEVPIKWSLIVLWLVCRSQLKPRDCSSNRHSFGFFNPLCTERSQVSWSIHVSKGRAEEYTSSSFCILAQVLPTARCSLQVTPTKWTGQFLRLVLCRGKWAEDEVFCFHLATPGRRRQPGYGAPSYWAYLPGHRRLFSDPCLLVV